VTARTPPSPPRSSPWGGRSLGIVVVAEGVETADQLRHLQELDCEVAQGYLLQRPATAETIDVLLANDVRFNAETT